MTPVENIDANWKEVEKALESLIALKDFKAVVDPAYNVVWANLEGLQKQKLEEAVKLYVDVEALKEFSSFLLTDVEAILQDPAHKNNEESRKEIYQNAVASDVAKIVADVLVMKENPFINAPENLTNAYFGEPDVAAIPLLGSLFQLMMTDMPLPNNLDDILEDILTSASNFLNNFPGYAVSLKSDIKPPPSTTQKGPATIFDDADLEKSLTQSNALVNSIHYIGFLLDKQKSNGKRKKSFLPVRTAPGDDKSPLALGWNDFGFSLVDHEGKLVDYDDDDANGIEVPLGLGIEVTEIVRGNTGVWVGFFISPNEGRASQTDLLNWTKNSTRILYTKIQYVRRRTSAQTPDPYISEKVFRGATPDPPVQLPDGAKLIDGTNLNWKTLEPLDVRLSYFNFSAFNKKEMGDKLKYEFSKINSKPTIRFSEGYYYFIVGQGHRLTTEEIIDKYSDWFLTVDEKGEIKPLPEGSEQYQTALTEIKQIESVNSTAAIKEKTFKNLLLYLGKNIPVAGALYQTLKNDHLTPVMMVTRTGGVSPENQKVLFAIPVNYVDSLPESTYAFGESFDPETESQYLQGRDFSFTVKLKELPKIVNDLVKTFESMKGKLKAFRNSGGIIKNANDINYDIDAQIASLKEFPSLIDDFMKRQAFPFSTSTDDISNLAAAGTQTLFENDLIQIGLRDNRETGALVRKTISYIIYSPDPKAPPLQLMNDKSRLLELDPYLTQDELEDKATMRRSGVVLLPGAPLLRSKLVGIQGTRTLHYIWAHRNMMITATEIKDDAKINKWVKFLQAYSLPPLKIKLSKEGAVESTKDSIDCAALIEKMRKSPNVSSAKDRALYEQVLNNPRCREMLAQEWGESTSAADPETSREAIKLKNQQLMSTSGPGNKGLKILFDAILHNVDPEGLMNLLMACLQAKLGLPMTKEAICEAAIIRLIEAVGVDEIKKIMLEKVPALAPFFAEASSVLSPDAKGIIEDLEEKDKTALATSPEQSGGASEWSVEVEVNGEKKNVRLNSKFKNSPIATAFALSGADFASPNFINLILNLEKGGSYIELVPATRPLTSDIEPLPSDLPGVSILEALNLGQRPEKYTWAEIDREKIRLIALGYSTAEAEAKLVQLGYLVPNKVHYEPLLSGETSILDSLENLGKNLPAGNTQMYGLTANPANLNTTVQDARNFLNYLKRLIDLQEICEAIVGPLLELPFSLIKGDGANWGDDFIESMKRFFKPPQWGIKFPDNLKTDNLLGDYSEMLFETFVSMIGIMLGQIINLILKQVLESCFEEDEDPHPGAQPLPDDQNPANSIPIGAIAVNLPPLPAPTADMRAWLVDLLDHLQPGQICSLLKGEASHRTLRECIERTKQNWPVVYNAGVNTGLEIQTIFKNLGDDPRVNIDICNFLDNNIPVQVDLCASGYNYDERCEQLLESGLTEEECEEQIRREIDDLREKVLAIASFLGGRGLDAGLPPMCGPNGYFSLPEGAKHSMESLTDNILSTVKQALMVDLQSLKFFSMPPRAVLALTDPEEMERAHKMFVTAIGDPYAKYCMLLSTNLVPKTGWNSLDIYGLGGPLPNYALMYNDVIHHGFAAELTNLTEASIAVNPITAMEAELNKVVTAATLWQAEIEKYENYGSGFMGDPVDFEMLKAHLYVKAYEHDLFDKAINWDLGARTDAEIIEIYMDSAELMSMTIQYYGKGVVEMTVEEFEADKVEPLEGQILAGAWLLPQGLGKLWQNGGLSSGYQWGDAVYNLHKELMAQSNTEFGANMPADTFFNKEKLLPITNDVFLNNSSELVKDLDLNSGNETYVSLGPDSRSDKVYWMANNVPGWYENLKTYFNKTMLEKNALPEDFAYVDAQDIGTIQNYYSVFNKGPELKELVAQSFISDTRDVGIDSLLYTPEIYKKRNNTLTSMVGGATAMSAHNTYLHLNGGIAAKLYIPTGNYTFQTPKKDTIKSDVFSRFLFTSLPLDTRLKDIGPYYLFGPMLRMYTGVNIVNLMGPNDKMNPPGKTANPNAWKWTDSVNKDIPVRCPGIKELEDRWAAKGYPSQDKEDGRENLGYYSKIFHETMTLGEATGLTEERLKKLYPNHKDLYKKIKGVVLEFGLSRTYGLPSHQIEDTSALPGGLEGPAMAGYIPVFVTYEETFRDPDLPFNKSPDEQLQYFSINDRKISPELDNNLQEDNLFCRTGVTSGEAGYYASILEDYPNFNPNSLIYPMPFTEIASKGAVNDKSKEIIELMGSLESESSTVQTIIDDISISTEKKSLGLHNHGPQEIAFSSQENLIRDSHTVFKAKIKSLTNATPEPGQTPGHGILGEEYGLFLDSDSKFMAGAGGAFRIDGNNPLDPDIRELLSTMAMSNTEEIFNNFKMVMRQGLDHDLRPKKLSYPYEISESVSYLSPLNFKAQIFGKLLALKFKEFYEKAGGNQKDPDLNIESEDFITRLQYVLTTYGFSSLQYAYTNQMFKKLLFSRLNNRKFMRKLWKKMLRSPTSQSTTALTAACRAAADEFGLMSEPDLQEAETDFFKLDQVKPQILEYYERSICRDLADVTREPENAARAALVEGCVMLLVKIYCLEVCLASLIAWDSYDLSDIFDEETIIRVVIEHMKQDISDLDPIILFANGVVRKQENLTNVESYLAPITTDFSALEFLIRQEGKNISSIVKKMFANSRPLSTRMRFDILKNSSPDFVREMQHRDPSLANNPDTQGKASDPDGAKLANIMASLFTDANIEYVADARLKNNIYTMNYGCYSDIEYGHNLYTLAETLSDIHEKTLTESTSLFSKHRFDRSDLYGYSSARSRPNNQLFHATQKDYLHSLPLKHWTKSIRVKSDEARFTDAEDWHNSIRSEGGYYQNYYSPGDAVGRLIKLVAKLPTGTHSTPSAGRPKVDYRYNTIDTLATTLRTNRPLKNNENHFEATLAHNLNAKYGNITFQPYVKIVDSTAEDRKKYVSYLYSDKNPDGSVCEEPLPAGQIDAVIVLNGDEPVLLQHRKNLGQFMGDSWGPTNPNNENWTLGWAGGGPADGNFHNSYIFGYVPLHVWSHFYNNVFLQWVEDYDDGFGTKTMKILFEEHGLKPFFKEISFGIRMTYSTSFPATDAPDLHFNQIMSTLADAVNEKGEDVCPPESAHGAVKIGSECHRGLDLVKTLFNSRLSLISHPAPGAPVDWSESKASSAEEKNVNFLDERCCALNELQIPIVEVERKLDLGKDGFSYGEDLISYEEMGYFSGWADPDDHFAPWTYENPVGDLLQQKPRLKELASTPHQFFYKYLAEDLLQEVQDTPEFRLMFEYIFPMKKYMSLGFLYAGESLSKFIPEPTDVLDETKLAIRASLEAVLNSDDYKYVPEAVRNQLADSLANMDLGTTGKEDDLTKQILKIIFMTPLIVLKSFVEITDPAVMIAKTIIEVANAIQQAVIAAIEQGIRIAKQAVEAAINQTRNVQMQLEIQVSTMGSILESTANSLKSALPEEHKSKIDIQIATKPEIKNWVLEVEPLSEAEGKQLVDDGVFTEEKVQDYNKFAEEDFPAVQKLRDDYVTISDEINKLEGEKNKLEEDLEEKVGKAKETAAKIFASPFLLPGIWASLMPSMIPYGGGIIPPPFFAGPPSTVPGMIYLALLLMDVYEEKLHDEAAALKGAENCEDQL